MEVQAHVHVKCRWLWPAGDYWIIGHLSSYSYAIFVHVFLSQIVSL